MLLRCGVFPSLLLLALQMLCFMTTGAIFLPFAEKPLVGKAWSHPLVLAEPCEPWHWLVKNSQCDAFANAVLCLGIVDGNMALFL